VLPHLIHGRWTCTKIACIYYSFYHNPFFILFIAQVARLCNIMLGMEKLWLHSLRDSLSPSSMPLGLKKEVKIEGMYNGSTQGTQHTTQATQSTHTTQSTQCTQLTPLTQPLQPPAMIQALVRGLADVNDKYVPPETTLDYPFTVICKTNNNTYFALLECIQQAVVQAMRDKEASTANSDAINTNTSYTHHTGTNINTPHTNSVTNNNTSMNTQSQRKRPWEEPYVYNPNTSNNANNRNGVSDSTGPTSHVTPVLARHALNNTTNDATPYTHHTNSTNTPYTNTTTTPGMPVQVLPVPPPCTASSATQRRFYVNGVKSYAQLESILVRRIEQLAQISITKPYMYKGEQYTDIEALRDVSTEMEDITLRELIDITKQWGKDIANIKNLIRLHYANTPHEADVFVTTVHKSKGLEWDNVALGGDLGAPLMAQPLFVIECSSGSSITSGDSGSGGSSGGSGGDGSVKYAICLEKTREDAFAAINFWLRVGEPATITASGSSGGIGIGIGGDGGSGGASNAGTGVKVKTEPGFGYKYNSGRNSSGNSSSSGGVIDLCDDEWTCSRCAHTNPDHEKSCDNCYVQRYPAAFTAGRTTNTTTTSTTSSSSKPKKFTPFAADALDYGGDGYDTAPDEALLYNVTSAGNGGDSGGTSGGGVRVEPSHSNKLVPLLPSTVALGYMMLRGAGSSGSVGGNGSGGTNSGGNGDGTGHVYGTAPQNAGYNKSGTYGGGASKGSKCPLICLYATHIQCRARVLCMFQHEVAHRKKAVGSENVCVIGRTGDGPVNYRLDYNNPGSTEDSVQVMHQFRSEGGKVPGVNAQGGCVVLVLGVCVGCFIILRYSLFNLHAKLPNCFELIESHIPYFFTGAQYIQAAQPTLPTQAAPLTASTPDPAPPRFDPFMIKFSNRQNANEWYVAVSRAKCKLRVNKALAEVLEWIDRDIGGLRTVLKGVIGDEAEAIV